MYLIRTYLLEEVCSLHIDAHGCKDYCKFILLLMVILLKQKIS